MPEFAIVATHRLKAGQRGAWAELAIINAASARKEPGCLQFDVLLPSDDEDTGILIERYVDQPAWDFHFKQSYCQSFMKAIEDLLRDKMRTLCDLADR